MPQRPFVPRPPQPPALPSYLQEAEGIEGQFDGERAHGADFDRIVDNNDGDEEIEEDTSFSQVKNLTCLALLCAFSLI